MRDTAEKLYVRKKCSEFICLFSLFHHLGMIKKKNISMRDAAEKLSVRKKCSEFICLFSDMWNPTATGSDNSLEW